MNRLFNYIKKIFCSPLFKVFILYALSYGLMLFNAGVYWDDWCLYNMNDDGIWNMFNNSGAFYLAPIHIFLQNLTLYPVQLYHLFTFILYFSSIIFFYYTLPYFNIEKKERFILTSIFAVLPINAVRFYMICFPYAMGVFFLFLTVYLFTKAFYEKKVFYRISALFTSAFAYLFLSSTLFFFLLYLLFIFILEVFNDKCSYSKRIKSIFLLLLKYFDFIVIAILAVLFFAFFVKPEGLYAGYNSITINNILLFPFRLLAAFVTSSIALISTSTRFAESLVMIALFLIIGSIVYACFYRTKIAGIARNKTFDFSMGKRNVQISFFSIIGICFFVAGAFLYILAGKLPIFESVNSRHQILLGTGLSLLIYDLIINIIGDRFKKITFILIISLFVTTNIFQNLKFQRAYYMQLALSVEMKKLPCMENSQTFLFIDNLSYNEFDDTPINLYVLSGIAKKTFGDEKRLIVHVNEKNIDYSIFAKSGHYNINEVNFDGEFDQFLIVEKGDIFLNYMNVIKLMYRECFQKELFNQDIDRLLILHCSAL